MIYSKSRRFMRASKKYEHEEFICRWKGHVLQGRGS